MDFTQAKNNIQLNYFQVLFALFLGGLTFEVAKAGYLPFLSSLDLIFHEAGHVVLFFLGDLVQALGGAIGQLTVPVVFAAYFFLNGNIFSSAIMFWWFGENFVNISIYVADARAGQLPILGGKYAHDWTFILARIDLLEYDLTIAAVLFWSGVFIMVAALITALISSFFES